MVNRLLSKEESVQRQGDGQDRLTRKLEEKQHFLTLNQTLRKTQIAEENASVESAVNVVSTLLRDMLYFYREGKPAGKPRVVFLEGPPGTGKTFTAEFIVKNWMERVLKLVKDDQKDEEAKETLEEFAEYFFGEGSTKYKAIQKIIKNEKIPFNKELKEILNITMKRSEFLDAKGKKRLSTSIYDILTLTRDIYSSKRNLEWARKLDPEILVDKVVLPAQEQTLDFIEMPEYYVDFESKELLTRRISSKLLSVLSQASEGKVVIFVLDELSELSKERADKSAKNLHDFLDAYLKGKPYMTGIKRDELTKEGEKAAEILEAKGFLKWDENDSMVINIPPTFVLAATGNERGKDALIGLLESTEERVVTYPVTYIPPKGMETYLNNLFGKWKNTLYELNQEMSQEKKIRIPEEALDEIKERLLSTYKEMYEKWQKREGVISLPSLRTIHGAAKILLTHLMTSSLLGGRATLSEVLDKAVEGKLENPRNAENGTILNMEIDQINFDTSGNLPDIEGNTSLNVDFYLLQEFITGMMKAQGYIPTGSVKEVSETKGNESAEERLNGSYNNEVLRLLTSKGYSTITSGVVKIDIKKFDTEEGEAKISSYYLSPIYYIYLTSMLEGLMGGQKFFFHTGITQEGKTTMVEDLFPAFVKTLIKNKESDESVKKIVDEFLPYKDVTVVNIHNPPENAQLSSSAIKQGEKSITGEPQLLTVIKEAQKHPDRLHIIIINEIDQLPFTQHLNELLTSDILHLGDKVYKTDNLIVMGTSNVSATYLDNFISRGILVYYYSPTISAIKSKEEDIEGRVFLSLVLKMAEIWQGYYKAIGKDVEVDKEFLKRTIQLINEVVSEREDGFKLLANARMHDIIRAIGEVSKDVRNRDISPNDNGEDVKDFIEEDVDKVLDKLYTYEKDSIPYEADEEVEE